MGDLVARGRALGGDGQVGIAGYFAVPFFVSAAAALTVESLEREQERSLSSYVWSRVVRVYVPFRF